ncbi:MAG TPA: protoglobin domain-containing protein [Kofleriaceae bacterium]|nr:protoglobin domain-containing protein [Kofleriaceae bacterium]
MNEILDELLRYVRFDEEDRARLIALHDKLEPEFPAIAGAFYEAVWANPGAAAVLKGPDQVERLRCTLIDWMSSGLLGPYDEAFYEKRSRIGRRHVAIGLAQRYMFSAINIVRVGYLDRIAKLYPASEALIVMRSVEKLFDVELALMLRHYQLDSEEKRVTRERAILADRLIALQTLSAGLAHEVRNPLNAAKLQLELLDRRVRKLTQDPKLLEPSELANHEIARLTGLLNEFLAFARAPELHAGQHDVVAIAHQVLELERPFAERGCVAVGLAPASGVMFAYTDPGKLHQIIQNLVRNAIEATPSNGKVDVELAVEGNGLHVRVRDTGPGMSDEVRRRIFEPFFSTKENGSGMGMSIVHSFVTMHAGSIDIMTSPRGTLVDVTLPQPPQK